MRKELLAAVIIGTTAFGCRNESQTPTVKNTPGIVRTVTPDSPITQWESLPAKERLKRLRENTYPKIKDFDIQREDTKAVVEFFCQNVRCNIPPEEILKNHIEYVNNENLAQKLQDRGFDYYSPEQVEQKKHYPAFVEQNLFHTNRIMFINNDAIKTQADRAVKKQPELLSGGHDFKLFLEQSIKFHELGHLNPLHEEMYFDEPIEFEGVRFHKFRSFMMVGTNNDVFMGVDEAMAELLAEKIRDRSGFFLSNPNYFEGVKLLSQLIKSAGISDQEFIEYTDGRRTIVELVERIGSLKENALYNSQAVGVNSLAEIGFVTEGLVDVQTGKDYLNEILKVKID